MDSRFGESNEDLSIPQLKETGKARPILLNNRQLSMLERIHDSSVEPARVHEVANMHIYKGGRDSHQRDIVLNNSGKLLVYTPQKDFARIVEFCLMVLLLVARNTMLSVSL